MKQIIITLCAASVFIGGFNLLIPGGKTEKSMRYISGLVMLLITVCAVLSVKEINFDLKNSMYFNSPDSALGVAQRQAEYIAGAALKDNGITFEKITAYMDISEDNDIFINKLEIYTDSNLPVVEPVIRKYFEVNEVSVKNE